MTTQALIPHSASPVVVTATAATTDQQLVDSWLASLRSDHSRRNFATTAERFLAALACPLRHARVEDVRTALDLLSAGVSASTARQYLMRVKSLLSYAHKLGYTPFNAGVTITAPREIRGLAKRLVGELDVADLIRSSRSDRDYALVAVAYAAGLRVSEIVGLNCSDVIRQGSGRVQLHVVGKGGKERDVLLPETLGPVVLVFCEGRPSEAPLFVSRREGRRLTPRAVGYLIKRLARRSGVTDRISPHWLRHAHASHSLDRGAPVSLVAGTLGHGNIATTSAYLHAKPGSASGDKLDPEVWSVTRNLRRHP